MSSLQPFVMRVKPAMDDFLRTPTKDSLKKLEQELWNFEWSEMKIFHVQIVLPLILKLEELSGHNQDLRTGTINCIRIVTSKLFIKDVKALSTMVLIVLRQIRNSRNEATAPNISEELKLAVIQCITESFRRSTTDVLEAFYSDKYLTLLGQVLLTLVEFLETEKYKKLVNVTLDCLMVVFYIHNDADDMDVVLRSQVANTLFIFLPRVVKVLFKLCVSDDKLGDTIKISAITALSGIICIIYEETEMPIIQRSYNISDFQKLLTEALLSNDNKDTAEHNEMDELLARSNIKKEDDDINDRLKRMQGAGRCAQWFSASSRRLRPVFTEISILRSHQSPLVRGTYAAMCCRLMQRCGHHLHENFLHLLESVVALAEEMEDASVRECCQLALEQIQKNSIDLKDGLFDESCERLLDDHFAKLPRIIHRCDEAEQYSELLFLMGLFRNLSSSHLQSLFTVRKNMEMVCMCLVELVEIQLVQDLLNEEYALRWTTELDMMESEKKRWRRFRHLSSERCISAVRVICGILGQTPDLNRMLFDHLLEQFNQQSPAINEIILIMLWLSTESAGYGCEKLIPNQLELVHLLLEHLVDDRHWHLGLQPDEMQHLHVDKASDWYIDRTPGLYVSAVEVRKQDCDSDDDNDLSSGKDDVEHVTMQDAEFNVLHTCMVLDAVGHCATSLSHTFDRYIFRYLHKVLLKVASSNTMVYQAAYFAFNRIQRALKFSKPNELIETHTNYITYHLNMILKRTPDSQSAVDILSIVLKFSSRNALPHLESIFQTIREECAKSHQSSNIHSYLRVYTAFLRQVHTWRNSNFNQLNEIEQEMPVDQENNFDVDQLLSKWVECLENATSDSIDCEVPMSDNSIENELQRNDSMEDAVPASTTDEDDLKQPLPRHIEIVKEIMYQVHKIFTSTDQAHQILSLECVTAGLPLLSDYEDELLPLVHLIWQPLMEKFRLKDPLILNRSFSLLVVLATHAKDFILKRSLDDVIPFLKRFLTTAAELSENETFTVKTQKYKLQLKLLQEFANLIISLKISGRQLCDIVDVITLYLSQKQTPDLQQHAVQFFKTMRLYDGPLIYLAVIKVSHLPDFHKNVTLVLEDFGITEISITPVKKKAI